MTQTGLRERIVLSLAIVLIVGGDIAQAMTCQNVFASHETSHENGSRTRAGRKVIDLDRRASALAELNQHLRRRVLAQPDLIDGLLRALEQSLVSKNHKGATSSLLVLGPKGVGRTKVLEEAARFIGARLIQLDGSSFSHPQRMTSFLGAAPGEVGYGRIDPAISSQILARSTGQKLPISIVVLKDFDQADRLFQDWWLKALATGSNSVWIPRRDLMEPVPAAAEDSVDLRRTLVVATLSLGAEEIIEQSRMIVREVAARNLDQDLSPLGVGELIAYLAPGEGFGEKLKARLESDFDRPGFLNQWDDLAIAWPMFQRGYRRILDLEIRNVERELVTSQVVEAIRIRLTRRAQKWLVSRMDQKNSGAAGLPHLVKRHVTLPLSRALASGELRSGDLVAIDLNSQQTELIYYSRPDLSVKAKVRTGAQGGEIQSSDTVFAWPTNPQSKYNWVHDLSEQERFSVQYEDQTQEEQRRLLSLLEKKDLGAFGTLDAIFKLALLDLPIFPDLAIELLQKLPKKQPRVFVPGIPEGELLYLELLEKYQNRSYSLSKIEYVDIETTFLILSAIPSDWVSPQQAKQLKRLAKEIISSSQMSAKARKYRADLEALVDTLINERTNPKLSNQ